MLAHVRRRYDEVESPDGDRDWSAEYTDAVLFPAEGFADYIREHSAGLPAEVLAHLSRDDNEVETLAVDRDWWPNVTSA